MKRLLVILALILVGPGCRPARDKSALTFYLQTIHGNDEDRPPTPEARPIGAKLDHRLRSVWKWKHYWELKRDLAVVKPGQRVRRRMSAEREVELELADLRSMTARIYFNGRLTRSRTQPAEGAFYIVGGDEGQDQSWFIVVRRDRPLDSDED
ncbi:MAG TPA: hypothetical protein VN765_11150 [Candidatus Acidoferrum sp.]|nr:hypothetical protein [Candidatus Acidoferrum sp.]